MADKNSNDKSIHETVAHERLLAMTAQVAASYVENHNVTMSELPSLMASVYQSLIKLGNGVGGLEVRPEPAVSIKKSIAADYIVCLEDGKKLKMLKRHLKTAYNMTPDQYRERWGLSADYPMVAPNYAKQRSKLAKQIGLGTARRTTRQKAA